MAIDAVPSGVVHVSRLKLFLRAITRRCPQCGSGEFFEGWFTMSPRCGRCGLRTDRVVGHWIGAVGVNTIVSFGILAITLVAAFILTYPELPVVPLLALGFGVAIIVPIVFWPFSQTLWTAVDLAMRPAERAELDPRYEP